MKRVICFSLWGDHAIYNVGAIHNVLLAKKYFPGWICRFYYDCTVPKIIINILKKHNNVELFFIEKPSGSIIWKDPGQFGMLWRFYAFDDDDVEIWLSRDTDSRITPYEKNEINKFINSDKIIHSFRNKNEPPLRGGLTSFKNYLNNNCTRTINNTKLNIKDMMNHIDKNKTPFYTDENFLKNKLLPFYYKSYCYSLRTDGSIFPNNCGNYVGQVVDSYGYIYDKNSGQIIKNGIRIKKEKTTLNDVLLDLNFIES